MTHENGGITIYTEKTAIITHLNTKGFRRRFDFMSSGLGEGPNSSRLHPRKSFSTTRRYTCSVPATRSGFLRLRPNRPFAPEAALSRRGGSPFQPASAASTQQEAKDQRPERRQKANCSRGSVKKTTTKKPANKPDKDTLGFTLHSGRSRQATGRQKRGMVVS